MRARVWCVCVCVIIVWLTQVEGYADAAGEVLGTRFETFTRWAIWMNWLFLLPYVSLRVGARVCACMCTRADMWDVARAVHAHVCCAYVCCTCCVCTQDPSVLLFLRSRATPPTFRYYLMAATHSLEVCYVTCSVTVCHSLAMGYVPCGVYSMPCRSMHTQLCSYAIVRAVRRALACRMCHVLRRAVRQAAGSPASVSYVASGVYIMRLGFCCGTSLARRPSAGVWDC